MSNYQRCPICETILRHYKDDLYICNIYYSTVDSNQNSIGHYYQTDKKTSELIRDFKIGFDIWFYIKTHVFSYHIGNGPWLHSEDKSLTIISLYHRIYKMKPYL